MFPDQLLFIDGTFSPSVEENPTLFTSINPATSAPLARIHEASPRDLQHAVDAATKAFETWSKTTPVERSRILNKAVSILRDRNDEIARVESLDTGKPFSETSTVDVATGADVLEYFAGVCLSGLEGKMIRLREKAWVYTTKEPLGVCVGIGDNFLPSPFPFSDYRNCLQAHGTTPFRCTLESGSGSRHAPHSMPISFLLPLLTLDSRVSSIFQF